MRLRHFLSIIQLSLLTTVASSGWLEAYAEVQVDSLVQHRIWVKFTEPVPECHREAANIATGKSSLDQLGEDCSVIGIHRIFPESTQFEKAHQHYGLHQWYQVEFADTLSTSVKKLAEIFCKNAWVSTAEAIPVRAYFASNSSDTLSAANDPRYGEQWHFNNSGQSGGTAGKDIQLAAGRFFSSGDSRVIVAVIDGGIDTQHEDLQTALWVNQPEKSGKTGVDDDGNGYVDDIYGYDFSADRGKVYADRHGTHVAGTIGAGTNNGIGVAGVAGGDGEEAGVRLMSCAVFGRSGQGGFPAAFVYAADNGAVIAQNSWGGGGKSQVLEDAIRYFNDRAGYDNSNEKFDRNIQTGPMAGGLVVFAAGNNRSSRARVAYPASLETVMSVASLDHNDEKSGFSNYGSWVDIAAPGSEVLSTFPGNNYGYLSGTSMACPHVSGVAALVISRFQRQGFTNQHLKQILLTSADNVDAANPSYQKELGVGRINAYRALSGDDEQAPAAIDDLSAGGTTFYSANLNFTATGTDGTSGTAAYYEAYLSKEKIEPSKIDKPSQLLSRLPLSSGTTDTVVVGELQHSTTYYISLRVVDLLGNASPWSNIVRITTAEPPRIRVTPKALATTVEARQLKRDTLIIENTLGKSPLTFQLSLSSGADLNKWIQLSKDSGTVPPEATQKIPFTWDARSRYAGSLEDVLRVVSNDPINSVIEIPVQLTVTGTPELSVTASGINFGDVYRTFSRKRSLVIRNKGTDTLTVKSVEVENAVFSVEVGEAIIMPGEEQDMYVAFAPNTLGEQTGQLSIVSDDPQQPVTTVTLRGVGLEPPPLLLRPEDVVAEVVQEDSLVTRVRLQNTSFDDTLRWSADGDIPDWLLPLDSAGSLLPREVGYFKFKLRAGDKDLGRYATTIILRFFDNESATLPVTMVVVEPNLPPVWADSLIDLSVAINRAETKFDLSNLVSDPENDLLNFSFKWEGSPRVYASLLDSILFVRPYREGKSRGLITVTDKSGNQVEAPLLITVLPENQAPQPIRDTLVVEIRLLGEPAQLDLDSLFSDPDEDSLAYSFMRPSFSSDDINVLKSTVANLRIEDQRLTGQANSLGEQEATIYAYDPVGQYSSATLIIIVLPPNEAPRVKQGIEDQYLVEYQQWVINLTSVFSDPDGDTLSYQVDIEDTKVAQSEIVNDSLRIAAQSPGQTRIQVQAQDEAGDQVKLSFVLKVDQVTSVASVLPEQSPNVYPNPASDRLTIDHRDIQEVRIYNSQGTLCREVTGVLPNKLEFSVAALPSGVYSLVIFTQQGETHQKLLIKE